MEDPLARIHREYRDQCILLGKYRPFSEEELRQAEARHKALCSRPPVVQKRKRKHPPKGTAD